MAWADWHSDARPKMGTEVSVYFWHEDAAAGKTIIEEVFAEVDRINALMSTYVESSRISEINRQAATRPVVAGDELFDLIRRALEISELTDGAFDITYESVGQHYDFRERQRPDEVTIETGRRLIDYRLVELNQANGTVRFLEQGVRINLGGIAKGHVVERGVEILRSHGVSNAIVTAGGDTRLLGDRRGRPWMVGIRDPRVDGQVAISVPLEEEAISTSGDYERFFEEDGVRYHHIIQPSSGLPVKGVHSATVFGPDAVLTDALSTSVFVLGVDAGLKLIGCLPDYESIVIDAESRIFYSTGLEDPQNPDTGMATDAPGGC
jgi:thiamine biosynthesis lipoprotein